MPACSSDPGLTGGLRMFIVAFANQPTTLALRFPAPKCFSLILVVLLRLQRPAAGPPAVALKYSSLAFPQER